MNSLAYSLLQWRAYENLVRLLRANKEYHLGRSARAEITIFCCTSLRFTEALSYIGFRSVTSDEKRSWLTCAFSREYHSAKVLLHLEINVRKAVCTLEFHGWWHPIPYLHSQHDIYVLDLVIKACPGLLSYYWRSGISGYIVKTYLTQATLCSQFKIHAIKYIRVTFSLAVLQS